MLNHVRKSRPHALVRAISVACGFAVLCWGTYHLPNPFVYRSASIVDFKDGFKVRAESSGFVEQVLVDDGEWVEAGTPLLRLQNDELASEIRQREAEVELFRTRERIALNQGEVAEAQNARNDCLASLETLEARKKEWSQLQICAPQSGFVIAPNARQLLGQFVRKGDHLISLNNRQAKEIVFCLSPEQTDVSQLELGQTLLVEIGSRRRIRATLQRLNPKATTHIDEPKLIASHGGPLAIQQQESRDETMEKEIELESPHVRAIATLDSEIAAQLLVGERGYVVLGSASGSLGEYLHQSLDAWLARQWDLVTQSTP